MCASAARDAEASAILSVPQGGLAYWVAAVRECFEEAGVLLAVDGAGVIRFDDPTVAARFNRHRHAVHDGTVRLVDLCGQEGLRLDTGGIEYVSHWITPVGERRRFDTRFFLARAPAAQEPLHDDGETIESRWIRPQDALAAFEAGDLAMLPPTVANVRVPGRPRHRGRCARRGGGAASAAWRSSRSWRSMRTGRCESCCPPTPTSTSSESHRPRHEIERNSARFCCLGRGSAPLEVVSRPWSRWDRTSR